VAVAWTVRAGHEPDRITRTFGRVRDDLELPSDVQPVHGLRHTLATHATRSGADVEVLSERLGHSSVYTTLNTYRHLDDEDAAASAAMGAAMIGGAL